MRKIEGKLIYSGKPEIRIVRRLSQNFLVRRWTVK